MRLTCSGARSCSPSSYPPLGGARRLLGLYYAIAVLNDNAYREEFVSDLTDEMRDTFRLRAEYLQRRRVVAGVDLRAFLPSAAERR